MALKNTKIVRDIAQTYNKLLSSKPDIPASHRAQQLPENIQESLKEFRYDVSNTTKSPIMPKVNFASKDPERVALFEMNHLQPATYPKHIKVNNNPRDKDVWQLHKISDSSKNDIQYPSEEVKEKLKSSSLITETFRRNLLKGPTNVVGNRGYASSPFMIVSRHYSKKNKTGEKCEKPKRCHKGPCPPIQMRKECERADGSHCEHFYIDPKCKKKLSPYPSYSETCATDLEGDPSECFQCPWNKCGGVESIKPPKRKYHTSATPFNMAMIPGGKRKYHTSVRPFNMAMIPGHFQLLAVKNCDAKKKPCKAPPPKCGEKKDEKCPGGNPERKKKKCDGSWSQAYALWSAKENVVPLMPEEELLPKMETLKDPKDIREKFPYDKRQADYEYLRQKPCADNNEKCQKKKYKRVPDSCENDPYKRCAPDTQTVAYELQKCPQKPPKCPIKEKQKCPDVENVIDPRYKPKDRCCEKVKKEKAKGTRPRPKVFVPKKRNY